MGMGVKRGSGKSKELYLTEVKKKGGLGVI
jgi:hypothetical protein